MTDKCHELLEMVDALGDKLQDSDIKELKEKIGELHKQKKLEKQSQFQITYLKPNFIGIPDVEGDGNCSKIVHSLEPCRQIVTNPSDEQDDEDFMKTVIQNPTDWFIYETSPLRKIPSLRFTTAFNDLEFEHHDVEGLDRGRVTCDYHIIITSITKIEND